MNINEIKEQFIREFGGDDSELRVFASPGRVNLIGEHIDYCGGCVMPAALTMRTTIVARKRDDGIIRMKATDLDCVVEVSTDEISDYKGKLKWGDYQLGVCEQLVKEGYTLCGADLMYDDTVPHGGGLSSSAAIEVSTAICMETFAKELCGNTEPVDMIHAAIISQKAEHEYIGVKCGIMDQFASAMGKENHAIYLNCATLDYEHIPLNIDGYYIVLSNTNKKHSLGASKYNERRMECEEGLNALKTVLPNIVQLADVSPEEFEANKSVIENPVTEKRIKHVVYECDRVKKSAEALKANKLGEFGTYINASHDSLQYDYEVSCDELDYLVAEARKIDGVLGSRMTGAGFGGCTVSIIRQDAVDTYIKTVGEKYEEKFGHPASFYISEIGNGGCEIK